MRKEIIIRSILIAVVMSLIISITLDILYGKAVGKKAIYRDGRVIKEEVEGVVSSGFRYLINASTYRHYWYSKMCAAN